MSYKRNQVIWAIWQSMAYSHAFGSTPPAWFETRIRRLLDLDRGEEAKPPFAFMATAPRGRGADTAFTDFDAFCLALGIELLDAGFKQSEIVFLLKHVRPRLSKEYTEIMDSPRISPRGVALSKDFPTLPPYQRGLDKVADYRRFMLIVKVEKEAFPTLKKTKDPLFLEPVFCKGLSAMTDNLFERGGDLRKLLIVELSTPATLVKENLDRALEAKRGRG